MAKINFADRLKILSIGAAKIQEYTTNIENYLVQFFSDTKYLYSRTNIYGQLLNVVQDIAQILFFYHNDAVTEQNVLTAQKEISVRHFAEVSGTQVTRVKSSTGVARLELRPTFFSKFGTPVYIRKYAQLSNNETSVLYLVDIKEDQKILDATSSTVFLPLIQGEVKTSKFTADGSKLFVCELNDADIIEDSHIKVTVDGEEWIRKDSLFDMLYEEQSYFIKTGYLSQYEIIFGNGTSGKVPASGAAIEIEYLVSVGESGNFDENIFPSFNFVTGIFDATGDSLDISEHAVLTKESGFLMGSNGDSVDSLRHIIGYTSRANILMDARSFYAYLSKYSFISKIAVWTNETNRRINNIMILPNLYDRLSSAEDYFNVSIDEFYISDEVKNSIISSISESELAHLTNEMVWIDPVFRKFAALVYLEPTSEFIDANEVYSQIKTTLVKTFIDASFSRDSNTNDIPKSVVISNIQEIVGTECRVSVIFVSASNEEAKINGYYIATELKDGKPYKKRVEVPFGTDPLISLTERNDIDCRLDNEVPILRGGFKMLSNTGEAIELPLPVNLYIYHNGDWTKIE